MDVPGYLSQLNVSNDNASLRLSPRSSDVFPTIVVGSLQSCPLTNAPRPPFFPFLCLSCCPRVLRRKRWLFYVSKMCLPDPVCFEIFLFELILDVFSLHPLPATLHVYESYILCYFSISPASLSPALPSCLFAHKTGYLLGHVCTRKKNPRSTSCPLPYMPHEEYALMDAIPGERVVCSSPIDLLVGIDNVEPNGLPLLPHNTVPLNNLPGYLGPLSMNLWDG